MNFEKGKGEKGPKVTARPDETEEKIKDLKKRTEDIWKEAGNGKPPWAKGQGKGQGQGKGK